MKKIYLDYNSTAPLRPCAREAFVSALDEFGNPSSIHSFGRHIKNKILNAKNKIADLLNVSPNRILFTSGGTESNNTAVLSVSGAKTFVSPLEHPSVITPLIMPFFIKIDEDGVIDLVDLENHLMTSFPRKLVSVCLASNETGIMQDIDSILDITQKYHAFFHTDAIQALGRVPMSSRILDAHFITLCGHKIGGPMGIGLLILPETHFFTPLITGGGQQKGIRSGTENYPAIIGFAQALEEAMSELNTNKWSEVENLRDYLETSILKISPTTFIAGKNTKRLPNTSLLSMPDVESMTQVIAFDLEGIAVSAGSACSSGTVKPSDGLKAMQIPDHHLNALLRVSLGVSTTKAEIDHFISIWSKIYQKKHQTDSQEDITYAKRHF